MTTYSLRSHITSKEGQDWRCVSEALKKHGQQVYFSNKSIFDTGAGLSKREAGGKWGDYNETDSLSQLGPMFSQFKCSSSGRDIKLTF